MALRNETYPNLTAPEEGTVVVLEKPEPETAEIEVAQERLTHRVTISGRYLLDMAVIHDAMFGFSEEWSVQHKLQECLGDRTEVSLFLSHDYKMIVADDQNKDLTYVIEFFQYIALNFSKFELQLLHARTSDFLTRLVREMNDVLLDQKVQRLTKLIVNPAYPQAPQTSEWSDLPYQLSQQPDKGRSPLSKKREWLNQVVAVRNGSRTRVIRNVLTTPPHSSYRITSAELQACKLLEKYNNGELTLSGTPIAKGNYQIGMTQKEEVKIGRILQKTELKSTLKSPDHMVTIWLLDDEYHSAVSSLLSSPEGVQKYAQMVIQRRVEFELTLDPGSEDQKYIKLFKLFVGLQDEYITAVPEFSEVEGMHLWEAQLSEEQYSSLNSLAEKTLRDVFARYLKKYQLGEFQKAIKDKLVDSALARSGPLDRAVQGSLDFLVRSLQAPIVEEIDPIAGDVNIHTDFNVFSPEDREIVREVLQRQQLHTLKDRVKAREIPALLSHEVDDLGGKLTEHGPLVSANITELGLSFLLSELLSNDLDVVQIQNKGLLLAAQLLNKFPENHPLRPAVLEIMQQLVMLNQDDQNAIQSFRAEFSKVLLQFAVERVNNTHRSSELRALMRKQIIQEKAERLLEDPAVKVHLTVIMSIWQDLDLEKLQSASDMVQSLIHKPKPQLPEPPSWYAVLVKYATSSAR